MYIIQTSSIVNQQYNILNKIHGIGGNPTDAVAGILWYRKFKQPCAISFPNSNRDKKYNWITNSLNATK